MRAKGVRMMFGTMRETGCIRPSTIHVRTLSEMPSSSAVQRNRPSLWEQVSQYVNQHGSIGNAERAPIEGHG